MDGQNYLVFHTAADDSYMNSSANFKGADVTSNTEITMYFGSASAQSAFGYDSVVLTINADELIISLIFIAPDVPTIVKSSFILSSSSKSVPTP